MKYLVDTPEQIYGFLDIGAYVSAAERLLRARHVHSMLLASESSHLLDRFPLMKVQWPVTEALSSQILSRSTAALRTIDFRSIDDEPHGDNESGPDSHDNASLVSGALSAAALAGDLDSESSLVVLLEARDALISNCFAVSSTNHTEYEILKNVAHIIKGSVALVAVLFMGDPPMLMFTTNEGICKDNLFGGIVEIEAEAKSWQEKLPEILSRMEVPPFEEVSTALQSWLHRITSILKRKGLEVLQSIEEMSEMAKVEKQLKAFVASESSLSILNDWLKDRSASSKKWDVLCQELIGAPFDLWDNLFDYIFTSRAEQLLVNSLDKVELEAELLTAMGTIDKGDDGKRQASTDSGFLYGQMLCKKWKDIADLSTVHTKTVHPSTAPTIAHGICMTLDNQLLDVAYGVRNVIGCAGDATSELVKSREAKLIPLLNKQTKATMDKKTESLKRILEDIKLDLAKNKIEGDKDACRRAVQKAVLIGHLCRTIHSDSEIIPILLSPMHSWPKEMNLKSDTGRSTLMTFGGGRLKSSHKQRRRAENSLIEALTIDLLKVSSLAFTVWIDWSVEKTSIIFAEELKADAVLQSKIAPITWEKIVVPVDVDGGSRSEMKLLLPSSSSGAFLNFIFRALNEMQTAAIGISSKSDIMKAYAFALKEASISILKKATAPGGYLEDKISEKGRVQLLFDIFFLADVLSGASALIQIDDTDVKHRNVKCDKEMKALRLSISDAIDPIDWATYEPYLRQLEERYYHRTSVLLGEFMNLNRMHRGRLENSFGTSSRIHLSSDNSMNVHSAPRFMYLPISMPVVRSGLGSSRRLTKSLKTSRMTRGIDPRVSNTYSLLEDDAMSNKTLDFKSFVDSMGRSVNLGDISGGLFSSLTGR